MKISRALIGGLVAVTGLVLSSPAHSGRKKPSEDVKPPPEAVQEPVMVHVAHVSIGGEGAPLALGSGDLEAQKARVEAFRENGPDLIAGTAPDGFPGLAAATATGWGDSDSEAGRNALARVEEVITLRLQWVQRAVVGNLNENLPEGGWSGLADLGMVGGPEEVERAMALELQNLIYAQIHLEELASVTVGEAFPPGPVSISWTGEGETVERCGLAPEHWPGGAMSMQADATTGAAVDAVGSQLCRDWSAFGTSMMMDALAHANAESKGSLLGAGLAVVDGCQIACLQQVSAGVRAPEPEPEAQ